MPKPITVWQRDVISHEKCGEKCDINQADPTCKGEVIAQAIIKSDVKNFEGIVDGSLICTEGSLEACVEVLAEWLGGQGWWVGGVKREWRKGELIEVTASRSRRDGKTAACKLKAKITRVDSHNVEYKVVEILEAKLYFKNTDIPMEGGFAISTSNHAGIRRIE